MKHTCVDKTLLSKCPLPCQKKKNVYEMIIIYLVNQPFLHYYVNMEQVTGHSESINTGYKGNGSFIYRPSI